MAFELIKAEELPKQTRRSRSSKLFSGPEWEGTVHALSRGLRPGQAILVSFGKAEGAKYKLKGAPRLFALKLKDYLKNEGMTGYKIRRLKIEGGEAISVSNRKDK